MTVRMIVADAIHGMCAEEPFRAFAYEGSRFIATGSEDEVLRKTGALGPTQITRFPGKTIVPGLIDSHQHPSMGYFFRCGANLEPSVAPTHDDIVRILREEAERTPEGEWIVGFGYNEWNLEGRRSPDRSILDEVSRDRPIFLLQFSFHEGCVNSKALELIGYDRNTPDPSAGEIVRDRKGNPTGRLIEQPLARAEGLARRSLVSRFRDDFKKAFLRHEREMFALGITRIADACVTPDLFDVYSDLATDRETRIPTKLMPFAPGVQIQVEGDWLERASNWKAPGPFQIGPAKMVLDGCSVCFRLSQAMDMTWLAFGQALRSGSMAPIRAMMREAPKLGSDLRLRRGNLNYPDEQIFALAETALDRGFSIAIHAMGNIAVDQAIRVIEKHSSRKTSIPFRIEHGLFMEHEAMKRAANLDVLLATQPSMIDFMSDGGAPLASSSVTPFLAYRSMLDAGIRLSGSSDFPAASPSPWRALELATRRKSQGGASAQEDQAITPHEVLRMYTVESARAIGELEDAGTIEVGKSADFVVLSLDPLTADIANDELRVVATYLRGEEVHRAS